MLYEDDIEKAIIPELPDVVIPILIGHDYYLNRSEYSNICKSCLDEFENDFFDGRFINDVVNHEIQHDLESPKRLPNNEKPKTKKGN
jgi:hypothetical protein